MMSFQINSLLRSQCTPLMQKCLWCALLPVLRLVVDDETLSPRCRTPKGRFGHPIPPFFSMQLHLTSAETGIMQMAARVCWWSFDSSTSLLRNYPPLAVGAGLPLRDQMADGFDHSVHGAEALWLIDGDPRQQTAT